MKKGRRKFSIDWGHPLWILPIMMLALLFGMFIGATGGKTW